MGKNPISGEELSCMVSRLHTFKESLYFKTYDDLVKYLDYLVKHDALNRIGDSITLL